jgi:hypothetical protein
VCAAIMWLKTLATFFLVFGIFLALGFPWIVGVRPLEKVALEQYVVRFGAYLIVTMVCFVAAAACAVVWMRKERERFQAESRQNLEDLIEASLKSHVASDPKAHE